MDETDINAAVATLMSEMPVPVQNFLSGPERNKTVLSLSQKYGLHADQAGELERALIFMLLGVYSPAQFVSTLREAGIAPEIVDGITKDVNEQIFMRLRKEEEAPEITPRQELNRPTTASLPPLSVSMPPPARVPPPPRPLPIQAPQQAVSYGARPIPPQPATQPPPIREERKMPTPAAAVAPLPRPPQIPSPPPVVTSPRPAVATPVSTNMGPVPQMPAASMPKPPQPSQNREALRDVMKSYGVDPYRESPE